MKEDWVECTLANVCEKTTKVKRKEMLLSKQIKYLDIGSIDNFSNKIVGHKLYTWADAPSRAQQIIKKDDILFSTVRTYLKNIAKVTSDEYEGEICSSGFTVLRGKENILLSDYLFYYSLSTNFLNSLSKLQTGTSYPAVRDRDVFAQTIPLPPLPIQRAIVAKIEELFSSLDSGIADLEKAQKQLVIYRQAVLKKAFEGELTKEWREEQTNLPTAEELLDQIKEERQEHYEQQLEDWKKAVKVWEGNGKEGKRPAKPAIFKFFNSPVRQLKIEIPHEWFFYCVGNICSKTEYGSSSKSLDIGEIPVIRMGNMQNGKIDWSDLKFSSDAKEIKQYFLKDGDVLFNRTNSPELVGKTVQYKGERPAIFAGYLIRLNHIRTIMDGRYLNYFLNSHPAKVYGSYVKTDGVNQSNINADKLSNYPIPMCSINEQHQIVREIESRLSVCDKVEESIVESLEKAKALRQSILKKAFEGKLLSEEEIEKCKREKDYEPAHKLLERIKEEKKQNNKK